AGQRLLAAHQLGHLTGQVAEQQRLDRGEPRGCRPAADGTKSSAWHQHAHLPRSSSVVLTPRRPHRVTPQDRHGRLHGPTRARRMPHGRRSGVVAGTGRFLDALECFRFGPAELEFLRAAGIVNEQALGYLASYRFSGDIWGYAEGDCYFPGSPILVVQASFAQAVILETLILSILNHDCAIASAASRMVTAADGRPLIEMGSRRTHERAAVASPRAAYLV